MNIYYCINYDKCYQIKSTKFIHFESLQCLRCMKKFETICERFIAKDLLPNNKIILVLFNVLVGCIENIKIRISDYSFYNTHFVMVSILRENALNFCSSGHRKELHSSSKECAYYSCCWCDCHRSIGYCQRERFVWREI